MKRLLAHIFCFSAALTSVFTMAACGGKPAADGAPGGASGNAVAAISACAGVKPSAQYVAFLSYIKESSPTAQRFLTAAGTDSAAPEDGFRAMQDKGPSYYYGGDDAAKQKLKEKLASVGPYASLLIVYHGETASTGGDTITVALGGHYIGGEHDGTTATSRKIVVACADSAWKTVSTVADSEP